MDNHTYSVKAEIPFRIWVYVTLVILLWSTAGTVEVISLKSFSPLQFSAWSCVCGAAGVLAYLFYHGRIRELLSYRIIDHIKLFIISLLGFGLYFLLKYTAYSVSPVPEASVLQSTYMVFIALFAIPILGQSGGLSKLFGIFMGFCGVVLVISGGTFLSFEPSYMPGYFCALAAGISFGLFSVFSEKAAFDRITSLFFFHFYSAILMLLILAGKGEFLIPTVPVEIAGIFYNGIAVNVLGIFLWLTAQGSTDDVSLLTGVLYLVPFISLLFFHLFLGLSIPMYSLQGLMLIVGGMAIHIVRMRMSRRKESATTV